MRTQRVLLIVAVVALAVQSEFCVWVRRSWRREKKKTLGNRNKPFPPFPPVAPPRATRPESCPATAHLRRLSRQRACVVFCCRLGVWRCFFAAPGGVTNSPSSSLPFPSLNLTTLDDHLEAALSATRSAVDGRLSATREAVGERVAKTRNATRAALSDRLTVRVNARPATTIIVIAAAIPALTIAAAIVAVYAAVRARSARAATRYAVLAATLSPVMAPVAVAVGKVREGPPPATAVVSSGKTLEGPPPPTALPVQFVPPLSGVGTGMSTPRSRRGSPRGG